MEKEQKQELGWRVSVLPIPKGRRNRSGRSGHDPTKNQPDQGFFNRAIVHWRLLIGSPGRVLLIVGFSIGYGVDYGFDDLGESNLHACARMRMLDYFVEEPYRSRTTQSTAFLSLGSLVKSS